MTKKNSPYPLAQTIANDFKSHPAVQAIALGGSRTAGSTDSASDLDIYVFVREQIELPFRRRVAEALGTRQADLGLTFWDPGDEWIDLQTGLEVDMVYWHTRWISDQIKSTLVDHQPRMGYSTCFWHTVMHAQLLYDRENWFTDLQQSCRVPYPKRLKEQIIKKNLPVLREVIPSYYHQIQKAIKRNDHLSINHRTAAFFESYFDILFAVNELPHPGEKKQLAYALQHCQTVPDFFTEQVEQALRLSANGEGNVLDVLDNLVDGLEGLLKKESLY